MRAIVVAVGYADLLAITLPWNRRHFTEMWVITDLKSAKEVCDTCTNAGCGDVIVACTDLFYENGATFNKWAALEWGLDKMGRHGWLCHLDADVIWPASIKWQEIDGDLCISRKGRARWFSLRKGELCSPLRRMWNEWPALPPKVNGKPWGVEGEEGKQVLMECEWAYLPIHRNTAEWAGYSQIYHADDPVLGKPPWHELDWATAGSADSFFQRKWAVANKVRPPFECLHLGPAGTNWCGRATALADGTMPKGAEQNRQRMEQLHRDRRQFGFTKEKINKEQQS